MASHVWQNIIENNVHGVRRESSKENLSLLSFTAADFIDMLLRTKRIQSRERGVDVGEALRTRDVIRPVNLMDSRFQDNQLRWICRADEMPSPEVSFSVAALMADNTYTLGAPFMKKGKFFVNPRFFVLDRILSRLYVFSTEYSMSARYYVDFARYEPCSVNLFGPNNSTVDDPDGDATDDSDTEDEYSNGESLLSRAATLLFEKKGHFHVTHSSLDSSRQQENSRKYPWQPMGAEEQSLPGGRGAQWGFEIRGANGLRILAYTSSKKRAITWRRAISAAIRKKPPRPVLSHSQQRIWKHTSLLLSSIETSPSVSSLSGKLSPLAKTPLPDAPSASSFLGSSLQSLGPGSLANTVHSVSISSSQGPSSIAHPNSPTLPTHSLSYTYSRTLSADSKLSATSALLNPYDKLSNPHMQLHSLDPIAPPEESDPSSLSLFSPILSNTPVTIRQLLSIPHYLLRNLVSPTWSFEFATAIYNLHSLAQEQATFMGRKPVFPRWGLPQPDLPSPTFIPLLTPEILSSTIPERLEEKTLTPSVFATVYTPTLEAFSKNVSTFWRYLDISTMSIGNAENPSDCLDTPFSVNGNSRQACSNFPRDEIIVTSPHGPITPLTSSFRNDVLLSLPPVPPSLSSYLVPSTTHSYPSPSTTPSKTPHLSPDSSPQFSAQSIPYKGPLMPPIDRDSPTCRNKDSFAVEAAPHPIAKDSSANQSVASPSRSVALSSQTGTYSATTATSTTTTNPAASATASTPNAASTPTEDHTSSHLLPLRLLVMNPELLESELGIFIPSHARYILERCSAFVPLIPEDEVENPVCDVCFQNSDDLLPAPCACGGTVLHCNTTACSSVETKCDRCRKEHDSQDVYDPSSPTTVQNDMDKAIFEALAAPAPAKTTESKTSPSTSTSRRHTAFLSKSYIGAVSSGARTKGDGTQFNRTASRSSMFLSYLPGRTNSVFVSAADASEERRERAQTLMATHRKFTFFSPASVKHSKKNRPNSLRLFKLPSSESESMSSNDAKKTPNLTRGKDIPMNVELQPQPTQHPLTYYVSRFPYLNAYVEIPDIAEHIEAFQHILFLLSSNSLQNNSTLHIPHNPFSVARATCTLKIHTLFAYYHNTMINSTLPVHTKGNDASPALEDELAALLLPTAPMTMGDGEKLLLMRKSSVSASPDKSDSTISNASQLDHSVVHNMYAGARLSHSEGASLTTLKQGTEVSEPKRQISPFAPNSTPRESDATSFGVDGSTSHHCSIAFGLGELFPKGEHLFPSDGASSPSFPSSSRNLFGSNAMEGSFKGNMSGSDNICDSPRAWCSPSVSVLTNWMEDLFLTCVHILTTYGERRSSPLAAAGVAVDTTSSNASKHAKKLLSSHDWTTFLSMWHAQFEVYSDLHPQGAASNAKADDKGSLIRDGKTTSIDSSLPLENASGSNLITSTPTVDIRTQQLRVNPSSQIDPFPAKFKIHPLIQRVRSALVSQLNQLFTQQLVYSTLNGRSPLSLPLQHAILPLMATYSTRALAQIHPAPDSSEVTHACIADVQTVLGYLIQFNEALPYPLMNALLDYAHTGRAMNPPEKFLSQAVTHEETLECYGLTRGLAWDVICQVLSTLEYSLREMRNLTRNIVFRTLFATPLAPNLLSIFQWCHAEENKSFYTAIRDLAGVSMAQLWIDPKYQIDQSILHTKDADFVDYETAGIEPSDSRILPKLPLLSTTGWKGPIHNMQLPPHNSFFPTSLHRHIHMLTTTQLGIRPPPLAMKQHTTTLRINVEAVANPTQWPPVSLYFDPRRSFSFPASTLPVSGLFSLLQLLPLLTDPLELVQWLILLVDALCLCVDHAIGWIDTVKRRRQKLELLTQKEDTKRVAASELHRHPVMEEFEQAQKYSSGPTTSSSLNADELLGIFCWFLASSYLLHDSCEANPVDTLPSLIHYVIALSPQDILLEKPGFLLTTLHAATQFIGTRAWKDSLSCSRCEGLLGNDSDASNTNTNKSSNGPKRSSRPMQISHKCYHCGMLLCVGCHAYLHGTDEPSKVSDKSASELPSMNMRHHHVVPFSIDKSGQSNSPNKLDEEANVQKDTFSSEMEATSVVGNSLLEKEAMKELSEQDQPPSHRVRLVSFHMMSPGEGPDSHLSTFNAQISGRSMSFNSTSSYNIQTLHEAESLGESSLTATPEAKENAVATDNRDAFVTPIRSFIPSSPYVSLRQEKSTFPHLSLDESTQFQTPSITTPVRSRLRANTAYLGVSSIEQDALSDSGVASRRMSLDIRILRNHKDARSTSFASPRDFF